MTTYTVRPYETGPAGHLYVIRNDGRDESELDRTLLPLYAGTCDPEQHATCLQYNDTCGRDECRRPELVIDVLTALKRATTDTGFDTSLFRPPKGYTHPTRALERGPLRVYGLRYDKTLFVAGPAALKLVAQIQDDKDVANEYFLAERARIALRDRLKSLGCPLDGAGDPIPPGDELGRCYLPPAVLHPFR